MDKITRTQREATVDNDIAEKVSKRVLSNALLMLRGHQEAMAYYEQSTNYKLRRNRMYFKGLHDGQDDLRRVVRKAIFDTLTGEQLREVDARGNQDG